MSNEGQSSNFFKAFVPGLVLGLVIGAFGAAVLLPLLSGSAPLDARSAPTTTGGPAVPPSNPDAPNFEEPNPQTQREDPPAAGEETEDPPADDASDGEGEG